jgi:hypothetical protein
MYVRNTEIVERYLHVSAQGPWHATFSDIDKSNKDKENYGLLGCNVYFRHSFPPASAGFLLRLLFDS